MMEYITDSSVSRLRDIVRKNGDAVTAYETAAENAREIGLQSYFQQKSKERTNFIASLKGALPGLGLGGNIIVGSTTGTVQSTWMDIEAFQSCKGDEAMFQEAIKGDRAAVSEYELVLEETDLPPSAEEIIRQQMAWIKKDLAEFRTLEDVR